eukprot:jgi/Tetstr1/459321/TSEL_004716.t1
MHAASASLRLTARVRVGVRAAAGQQFRPGTGSLERNVAKLFTEKVKIFGEVQFTQASVLAAITRVGIKSLVECVRLLTLSRAGLQQLQLDVHFLRPQLRRFASAVESVDSLLDEVLGAAMERSVDPSLLEPGLLDRILDSYAKSRE